MFSRNINIPQRYIQISTIIFLCQMFNVYFGRTGTWKIVSSVLSWTILEHCIGWKKTKNKIKKKSCHLSYWKINKTVIHISFRDSGSEPLIRCFYILVSLILNEWILNDWQVQGWAPLQISPLVAGTNLLLFKTKF